MAQEGKFFPLKDITDDVNLNSPGCHFWSFGNEKRKIAGIGFNIHEISMWSAHSVEKMVEKMTKEVKKAFDGYPKKAFFGYTIDKCQEHKEFVYFFSSILFILFLFSCLKKIPFFPFFSQIIQLLKKKNGQLLDVYIFVTCSGCKELLCKNEGK